VLRHDNGTTTTTKQRMSVPLEDEMEIAPEGSCRQVRSDVD
jgi:hypothetical protein